MQALSHPINHAFCSTLTLSFNLYGKDKGICNEVSENTIAYAAKTKVRILVVEDDAICQRVAQLGLEGMGYEVEIAGTGSQALDFFKTKVYAAILMDMGLPDMSGLEVTTTIRRIEQEQGGHIPIIALTAHGTAAKSACLAAGMDDFACKPFELEELGLRIAQWINHK